MSFIICLFCCLHMISSIFNPLRFLISSNNLSKYTCFSNVTQIDTATSLDKSLFIGLKQNAAHGTYYYFFQMKTFVLLAMAASKLTNQTHYSSKKISALVKAGRFFGHPWGGYGRHLASDGLSFLAKNSFFGGKSSFFHTLSNKNPRKIEQ